MKVGLVLMVLLTALAVVFSLFPSNETGVYSKFVIAYSLVSGTLPAPSVSFQPRFESPIFLIILATLSLTLAASVFSRMKAELRRRGHQRPQALLSFERPLNSPNKPMEILIEVLRRFHYQPLGQSSEGHNTVAAEKGTGGVVGSILFHFGLLIILLGIAVSVLASFRGSISLTEGQEFDVRHDHYGSTRVGILYTAPAKTLAFRLNRVEPDYVVNGASTISSFLSSSGDREVPVFINHKVVLGGREIHQGPRIGFSTAVRVVRDGKVLFDGFLRLATLEDQRQIRHIDVLYLPGDNSPIRFEFLPDAIFRNGEFTSRSENPSNPLLRVSTEANGKWISNGVTGQVGQYSVFLYDVRRWSQLDVVDDPGRNVMLLGVIFTAVGLVFRLMVVRKRITVTLSTLNNRDFVEVTGSSEKFPAEFRNELAALQMHLQLVLIRAGRDRMRQTRLNREDETMQTSDSVFEAVP